MNRKIKLAILALLGLASGTVYASTNIDPATIGQAAEGVTTIAIGIKGAGAEWLKVNWYYVGGIALVIFGIIAKLTKTKKDDKIVDFLKGLFKK